jgi:hypothetical protein
MSPELTPYKTPLPLHQIFKLYIQPYFRRTSSTGGGGGGCDSNNNNSDSDDSDSDLAGVTLRGDNDDSDSDLGSDSDSDSSDSGSLDGLINWVQLIMRAIELESSWYDDLFWAT